MKMALRNSFQVFGNDINIAEERAIDNIRYIKVLVSDEVHRNTGYYTADIDCRIVGNSFPDGSQRIKQNIKTYNYP